MVNLEEQVKLLVELQGIDTQIYKLKRDIEAIPEELKVIEDKFKEKTIGLKNAEDELKALQLKRKSKELDLETKEGAIKKQQSQMYQVKTNKEYTALDMEISRLKADNSLIEEEIIKILDQIDAQNISIAKEKEALKSQEAVFNEEKKKKTDEMKKMEAQLEGIKAQRSVSAEKVDKKILQKYERILANKDGLAVVPIANQYCQGCFQVLPPQVQNEVGMKTNLVMCENCSRILYFEG
jgi:hypothetical protein